MARTNAEIPRIARQGGSAVNAGDTFWTVPGRIASWGWHGYDQRDAIRALQGLGYTVTQAIYSWDTPVMFELEGPDGTRRWMKWDRSYSARTSQQMNKCWHLHALPFPVDASAEEIVNIFEGYANYRPGKTWRHVGHYTAGLVPRKD